MGESTDILYKLFSNGYKGTFFPVSTQYTSKYYFGDALHYNYNAQLLQEICGFFTAIEHKHTFYNVSK